MVSYLELMLIINGIETSSDSQGAVFIHNQLLFRIIRISWSTEWVTTYHLSVKSAPLDNFCRLSGKEEADNDDNS